MDSWPIQTRNAKQQLGEEKLRNDYYETIYMNINEATYGFPQLSRWMLIPPFFCREPGWSWDPEWQEPQGLAQGSGDAVKDLDPLSSFVWDKLQKRLHFVLVAISHIICLTTEMFQLWRVMMNSGYESDPLHFFELASASEFAAYSKRRDLSWIRWLMSGVRW